MSTWNLRLAAVHLVDSHYCTEPSLFIAVTLTSLATMLQLELPHVNILSKIDILKHFGDLDFNLEFYTNVFDLHYILDHITSPDDIPPDDSPSSLSSVSSSSRSKSKIKPKHSASERFKALNTVLTDVISDYSLVSFIPLNINEKMSVTCVAKTIDQALGYVQSPEDDISTLFVSDLGFSYNSASLYQELFIDPAPTAFNPFPPHSHSE